MNAALSNVSAIWGFNVSSKRKPEHRTNNMPPIFYAALRLDDERPRRRVIHISPAKSNIQVHLAFSPASKPIFSTFPDRKSSCSSSEMGTR